MGLFQLIQQHQTVGSSADGLRQLSALFKAHIAGRGADEPGYGVLFHILRHIQPDHGLPASVHLRRQCPAQLGFSHTGGTGKQQAGSGPAGVVDAAVAPAHRRGGCLHRPGLAADMTGQQPLQVQQPLPLSGGQPSHGNPRPGGHHPGNVGGGDGPGPLPVRGVLHQGLNPVPQLRRFFKPPLPHRLVELLLQSLPGGGAPGTAGFLHFGPGSPLVQQIDGLIRQVELRKIPDGQPHRLLHGLVRNPQVMVLFQPRLQGPQNPQGRFRVRLLHVHRPEPPLQSRVLFNIFPVLLPGGCPHHLQFSPAQGRLQDVRRVNGPLRRPRAHNGVHLIHKENHIPAAADFRQNIPEPFFKLSPVFGSRHQAGHVQAVQPLVL